MYLWGEALVVLVPVDGREIMWEGLGLVVVTVHHGKASCTIQGLVHERRFWVGVIGVAVM